MQRLQGTRIWESHISMVCAGASRVASLVGEQEVFGVK